MTIKIIQHIPEAGHYPGQILVDNGNELRWIDEGRAQPVKEEPKTAALPRASRK